MQLSATCQQASAQSEAVCWKFRRSRDEGNYLWRPYKTRLTPPVNIMTNLCSAKVVRGTFPLLLSHKNRLNPHHSSAGNAALRELITIIDCPSLHLLALRQSLVVASCQIHATSSQSLWIYRFHLEVKNFLGLFGSRIKLFSISESISQITKIEFVETLNPYFWKPLKFFFFFF